MLRRARTRALTPQSAQETLLTVDPDRGAYWRPIKQPLSRSQRQVNTAMRAIVIVVLAAVGGAPASIMQAIVGMKRHPVLHKYVVVVSQRTAIQIAVAFL